MTSTTTIALFDDLRQSQVLAYVDICSVALMFYDYVLTLPDEIRLVWPGEWSATKSLFYITRYCAFINAAFNIFVHGAKNPSSHACAVVTGGFGWGSAVSIGSAEPIIGLSLFKLFIQQPHFKTPLMKVLNRDGILYYICFLGLSLTNLVVVLTASVALAHVLSTFQTMLHSILAARVVIHIREIAITQSEGSVVISARRAFTTSALAEISQEYHIRHNLGFSGNIDPDSGGHNP
ncbi:hypothetical protein BDP27DRAFT_1440517 [Rhodocollybia butyracea]|uniref:DUF6533 domain-containing protein n=1 Tax=Rhodocollybia butyracea TaxID=206335 RepID=A0A9P5NZT5_9AGAR|nr:hypothetical protein BDP27DRAFT_1440517 [Rhodocollybia butyracea]